MKTIEITVGRLLCRTVRDYLKRLQFFGKKIEWLESVGSLQRLEHDGARGIFERTFYVRVTDEDFSEIIEDLQLMVNS